VDDAAGVGGCGGTGAYRVSVAGLDRLAELLPPAGDDEGVASAQELVETFLGFGLPDEYIEMSRRYGSCEIGLAGTDYYMYVKFIGVRELFLEGPSLASNDRSFRDEYGERFPYAPVPPAPTHPVTRLDTGLAADWPFWPERGGALPVGDSDGSHLYLLQHLHPGRWTVGWALHEWGVETAVGLADWLHGWLTGRHTLDGEPSGDLPPEPLEVEFRAHPQRLVVARLERSGAPLADRARELASVAMTVLRSPLSTYLTTDGAPGRYAAAGWQRLDFEVAVGDAFVRCWYDDAIDGSGNHRIGVLEPSARTHLREVLDKLSAALRSPITEVESI
jgi:hypothetical protein